MKNIFFLFCLLIICQCRQKVNESTANPINITEGEIINYKYDNSGRVSKETRKSYFMAGDKPDSLDIVNIYHYDKKGRKMKVEEHDASDKILTRIFFSYDQRDSLLAKYEVNNAGDTTLLIENIYDKDGNVRYSIHRQLLNTQSESDLLNGKSTYDTLFTLTENFYEAGLLKKSIDRDKKRGLTAERVYEYKQHNLVAMKVYEFPDSRKQLAITNYYSLKGNKSNLRRVTVNLLGDTTGVEKVDMYPNGKPAKLTTLETGFGYIFISTFNEIGQIISETQIFKSGGEKIIKVFTYDSMGRKIKVVSNEMPLSEKEKNML